MSFRIIPLIVVVMVELVCAFLVSPYASFCTSNGGTHPMCYFRGGGLFSRFTDRHPILRSAALAFQGSFLPHWHLYRFKPYN